MTGPRKNAGKTPGRRFQPGNPGKPKGARHKVTLAVEALLEGEAEGLTRKAIEQALAGDVTALRLCLDRIAPATRERTVKFDLPTVTCAEDVPAAIGAIMQAVASGDLAPGEGAAVASLLDRWRVAYEVAELEQRITALEGERSGS